MLLVGLDGTLRRDGDLRRVRERLDEIEVMVEPDRAHLGQQRYDRDACAVRKLKSDTAKGMQSARR